MEQNEQILINSPDKAPTILQSHRDGIGIRLVQGGNYVVLDGDELHRLLQAINRPPTITTPAKARPQAFKIGPHGE